MDNNLLLAVSHLLIAPPGNLAYHLVILFAIGGAFQAAWLQWQHNAYPQTRRLLQGLGTLLTIRLLLFIVGGLAWQQLAAPHLILPIANRTATALTIVLFAWLWGFPERTRHSDTYFGLVIAAILFGSVLSWLAWRPNADHYFNNTLLDLAWSALDILLGLLGIGIVLHRRPNHSTIGVLALALLASGPAAHILWPPAGGDLDGYTRLAALIAHPFLLTLPYRFLPTTAPATPRPIQVQKAAAPPPDTAALQALLDLLATPPQHPDTCPRLARAIALLMKADLCLIFTPPDRGRISIACGYDLIREQALGGTTLDAHAAPILVAAMQRRRALRLPASSTSDDVRTLAATLNLQRPGPLLAAPLAASPTAPLHGSVVLASPYAQHAWTREEQTRLEDIAHRLARWLTPPQPAADQTAPDDQQITALRAQIQTLQTTLEEQTAQNAKLTERLQTLAAAYDEAQRLLERLKEENQHLQQAMAAASAASAESEAYRQNMEILLAAVQDLRQPLSSLVGYTDLLLGESAGILGALQRQFLERIRVSGQRLQQAVDDLAQTIALETNIPEKRPQTLDLNAVIDQVIGHNRALLREKRLLLRVDLPDSLPLVQLDREMLYQILHHLVHNAALASPPEGEIQLRLRLLDDAPQQGEGAFLLLEIQDSGSGIAPEDIPHVFSRRYRTAYRTISGLGDNGLGLPLVKALVDAMHGRIWIESAPAKGSRFSVLLPLLSPNSAMPAAMGEAAA